MEIKGLFGRIAGKRNPGGHHDWLSRDYADVDCQAVGCLLNRQRKCTVPTACKIGDDGRCQGFTPRPTPKVDGD